MIYTRDQLKSLKEENDKKIYENNVQQFVNEISNKIISIATTSTNTSYVEKISPLNIEGNRYKIIMAAIDKLKDKFIDVSIEYKSQKDIRTGKEFNHGIYIDWS